MVGTLDSLIFTLTSISISMSSLHDLYYVFMLSLRHFGNGQHGRQNLDIDSMRDKLRSENVTAKYNLRVNLGILWNSK